MNALAGALLLCAQDPLVTEASVPLEPGARLLGHALVDMDGDGLREAVLLQSSGEEGSRPELSLFARTSAERFAPEPVLRAVLGADTVAFAVGELHPDEGREIALLGASGYFVLRPGAAEAERFAKLLDAQPIWQVPDLGRVPHHPDLVVDLDGDGLDDLVCPEPDGFRVAFQRRTQDGPVFETVQTLGLPRDRKPVTDRMLDVALRLEAGVFSIGGRIGNDDQNGPLLQLSSSIPVPRALDFDADGRLDLLAQGSVALYMWRQEAGAFGGIAAFPSPVVLDERRMLDVSLASLVGDLDGDGHGDWLWSAGDQRSDKPRTQILVHLQRTGAARTDGAAFSEIPDGVLVLDGFAVSPELVDADGDGDLDLALGAVRQDLLSELRSSSERVEIEQYVYRNDGGTFARRPVFAEALSFALEDGEALARFVPDASGDGVRDLLVRDSAGRLELRWVRPGRDGWSLHPEPLWRRSLEPGAQVLVASADGFGVDSVVLIEASRLGELVW